MRTVLHRSNIMLEWNEKYERGEVIYLFHKQIPRKNPIDTFRILGQRYDSEKDWIKAEPSVLSRGDLDELLPNYTKYKSWRSEEQRKTVKALVDGKCGNVLSIIPTAGGKSLIFYLVSKIISERRLGTTWVITPTISLMDDQAYRLTLRTSGIELKSSKIDSTLNPEELEIEEARIKEGIVDIIFTTPKLACRTDILYLISRIPRLPVELFVIDEAHLISDWGMSFYPEYRRLNYVRQHLLRKNNSMKTLLLSATVSDDTRTDIIRNIFREEPRVVIDSCRTRDKISFRVKRFDDKETRWSELVDDVKRRVANKENGIVYCLIKSGHSLNSCEEFHRRMKPHARTAVYTGSTSSSARRRISDKFREGEINLIIATKAFGLGIDKKDVRFVHHLGYRKYVHHISMNGKTRF